MQTKNPPSIASEALEDRGFNTDHDKELMSSNGNTYIVPMISNRKDYAAVIEILKFDKRNYFVFNKDSYAKITLNVNKWVVANKIKSVREVAAKIGFDIPKYLPDKTISKCPYSCGDVSFYYIYSLLNYIDDNWCEKALGGQMHRPV